MAPESGLLDVCSEHLKPATIVYVFSAWQLRTIVCGSVRGVRSLLLWRLELAHHKLSERLQNHPLFCGIDTPLLKRVPQFIS